eukprot:CAMPEP_0203989366 /NCGR_PEP_ID=MMETSP0360-20130528/8072_1 /ASSEMBLY_ACC=CAM_ASM_000342 /TAXON_ID=268821 /ORGANISM="Scrippsiella Hangoei, Strain SHTV-5" /LENGTH=65 /DNA_ID=CAMNT_0050929263 /DNA_START=281 /DNA_END=474 /DNA_ORIENTATION=+
MPRSSTPEAKAELIISTPVQIRNEICTIPTPANSQRAEPDSMQIEPWLKKALRRLVAARISHRDR